MDTTEMDRYEKRAQQLEEGQAQRFDACDDPENFYLRKHETEVLTLIEMFRKASKTYQGE